MTQLEWKAEVKKQLTLRGETLKTMAEKLEISHNYARRLASGVAKTETGIKMISDFLGIEPYEE